MSGFIMNGPMNASDWKIYRELHPVMSERYAAKMIAQIQQILSEPGASSLAQIAGIAKVLRDEEQSLADATRHQSRANAMLHLAAMDADGLIPDEVLTKFSEEARGIIDKFRANRAEANKASSTGDAV